MATGLFFQLCFYMIAIGFSAGGGNTPDAIPSSFIFIKALGMSLPLVMLAWNGVTHYRTTIVCLGEVVRNNKWLITVYVAAFLSLPLAVNPTFSFERLAYTLFGLAGILALCAQYFLYEIRYRNIIEIISNHVTGLGWFIVLLCGIALYKSGAELIELRQAVQSYAFIHPNMLASLCGHLLLFQLFFISQAPKQGKAINHLLSLVLIGLIFLLFSRAVLLAFISVMIIAMIIRSFCSKNFLWLIPPLLLGMTAGFLILNPEIIETGLSLLTRDDTTDSLMTLTHRTELWRQLFDSMTLKIFFLGNGYAVMIENYGVDFGTGILYGAHNGYLSLLFGCGILSLIFFLIFLANLLRRTSNEQTTVNCLRLPVLLGTIFFALNCLTAEEVGVHISVTLAYLVWLSTLSFHRMRLS